MTPSHLIICQWSFESQADMCERQAQHATDVEREAWLDASLLLREAGYKLINAAEEMEVLGNQIEPPRQRDFLAEFSA